MRKEYDYDKSISFRLKFMLCICALMLIVCAVFTYIAIFASEESKTVMSMQYTKNIMLAYPRGTVYDRNGIPFTNRNREYPFLSIAENDSVEVAKNVIGDVQITSDDTTALGCVGISGINLCCDKVLNGGSPILFYSYVDANGNTVNDNYYISGDHINEGCDVHLTLDYNIQKTVEDTIELCAKTNGYENVATVLTEVETGKIVAMVSYGGYLNHAVLSYQPGSIMKIITAAVAYEMGIIDENTKYICNGTVDVCGTQKGCMHNVAHGEITISEAFALSCNCCFYDLAQKLTYVDASGATCSYMLDKAKEWGFNEYGEISTSKFILEYSDYDSFICSELFNDMDIFNSALGQGKIQASPYLINSITCAIAAEKTANKAYIIEKITDSAENELDCYEVTNFDLGLSEDTLRWLKDAMKQTYISGTASKFDFSFCGGIAGKTGTAENTQNMPDHAWFTGFYPANEPKYAITVLIPYGKSGSNAVAMANKIIAEVEKLEIN